MVQSSRKFFSMRSRGMQVPSVWLLSHPIVSCLWLYNHSWFIPGTSKFQPFQEFPFPMLSANSFHVYV